MPLSHHASDRIAARIASGRPASATPWIAPNLADLIARIDAALGARDAR